MTDSKPVNTIHVWLSVVRPASLLIVAPGGHELADEITGSSPTSDVSRMRPGSNAAKVLGQSTFDAALVLNALEMMAKKDAGVLLGRLRDVHTRRFLVLLNIGSEWQNQTSHWRRNDMIAYGLGLEAKHGPARRALHLYRFDIDDYKRTPEWLNPTNWAHPELWDKYRW